MPADIGTRKGACVNDVSKGSAWLEGYPWMKRSMNEFPVKSYRDIKEACKEASEQLSEVIVNKRTVADQSSHMISFSENAKRYECSHYLIDPNKFRFQKEIGVLALVYRFIKNCKEKCKHSSLTIDPLVINDKELQVAMDYFFRQATLEIKKSLKNQQRMRRFQMKRMTYCTTVVELYRHNQLPVHQHT